MAVPCIVDMNPQWITRFIASPIGNMYIRIHILRMCGYNICIHIYIYRWYDIIVWYCIYVYDNVYIYIIWYIFVYTYYVLGINVYGYIDTMVNGLL